MSETQSNPLNPNYIVRKIATSEAYVAGRNHAESIEGDDHMRRAVAIRLAATALTNEIPSKRLTLEGHAMNITSRLTTYMENQQQLDTIREQGGSYSEKHRLLTEVAEFNHAIKDMIDTNPSLKYSEVLEFLNEMNLRINGNGDAQHFNIEAKRILSGMRHEIAVEQMLWLMDGVEYEDTTIDDDMKGADLYISINGSRMTPIDIKSTEQLANTKRMRAEEQGNNPHLIVWSHVTAHDFHDGFRINKDTADRVAPLLYEDLLQAVHSYDRQAA